MDKDILLTAIEKLFSLQPLSDDETEQLKQYFTSRMAFPDMPDDGKLSILESTTDTFHDVFVAAVKDTISYSLRVRYGIQ